MVLIKYAIAFLVINFGGLAIGSWLMNNGPQTLWYQSLNQAPWTPPGWLFGFAWTTIMICFSVYLAYLFTKKPTKQLVALFVVQFVLNVSWNYIFFNQHLILMGLICIILLTIVIGKFLFDYSNTLKLKTLLILPYFLWLCVATSLNAYLLIYN